MKKIATILLLLSPVLGFAQDDLMKMAEDSTEAAPLTATFKGTRIVNGHSVETVGKNNMDFLISHRFGRINEGLDGFFGLDAATTRLGLEYGLNNNFTLGIGRSSFQKMVDLFGKYRVLRQTAAGGGVPVSLTAFGGLGIRTQNTTPSSTGSDRSSYTAQLLIARKFSDAFSLQISPTLTSRTTPDFVTDNKNVFATGVGGRIKLTRRTSLNGEWWYVLPDQINDVYRNNFSLGFDIETGGHVFQLLFTNSFGMSERQFITETTGGWDKGDIQFGFNIARTFSFNKKTR